MTRYVLDTNQIVAAGTAWLDQPPPTPDPVHARRLLIHIAHNETGLYCGKVIGEYLEKLVDRGHPQDRAVRLVALLMGAFERVEIVTHDAPHPPADPDDEIFLLCAMDGQAEYLVSEDHSLLDLRDHYAQFIICSAQAETARINI
jgi:predicted nucleic acid-binding protein